MRYLLLLLFLGCKPTVIKLKTPVEVKLVGETKSPTECWLIPKPEPVPDPIFPSDPYDGDFGKVFLHRRDYEALIRWTRDWDMWAKEVEQCIEKLRVP